MDHICLPGLHPRHRASTRSCSSSSSSTVLLRPCHSGVTAGGTEAGVGIVSLPHPLQSPSGRPEGRNRPPRAPKPEQDLTKHFLYLADRASLKTPAAQTSHPATRPASQSACLPSSSQFNYIKRSILHWAESAGTPNSCSIPRSMEIELLLQMCSWLEAGAEAGEEALLSLFSI